MSEWRLAVAGVLHCFADNMMYVTYMLSCFVFFPFFVCVCVCLCLVLVFILLFNLTCFLFLIVFVWGFNYSDYMFILCIYIHVFCKKEANTDIFTPMLLMMLH